MKFNIDEIFEMAEHFERMGAKFYRQAAEIVSSQQCKDTFLDLATRQVEHEQTYAEMRQRLSPSDQRQDTVYNGDDPTGNYIRSWVGQQIHDMDAEVFGELSGDETLDSILHKAIKREDMTSRFLSSMKEKLRSESDRKIVDDILREEEKHVFLLKEEMKTLAGC